MAKKHYQVVKRTKRNIPDMKFGASGAFSVSDPAVARDIEQKYGAKGTGEVMVLEDERTAAWEKRDKTERLHNYTFTMSTKIKLRKTKPDKFIWIKNGAGKWKRVSREEVEDGI